MHETLVKPKESFAEFLTSRLPLISERREISLISFHFPFKNFNPFEKKENFLTNFSTALFVSKPNNSFQFLALSQVHSIQINGKLHFSEIQQELSNICGRLITNSTFNGYKQNPLFIGGIKFEPGKSSDLWNDFDDANWFIPEFLFVKDGNSISVCYNVLVNPEEEFENIINTFEEKLDKLNTLYKIENNIEDATILSIKGNENFNKKEWMKTVERAVNKIKEHKLSKVVLSRMISIELSGIPSLDFLLTKLESKFPECTTFLFKKNKSIFFGATPERLAKFNNSEIEIDALAGSASRGNDPDEDYYLENLILKNEKNLQEHKYVVDYIKQALFSKSEKIYFSENPSVMKLRNIQHLWTKMTAKVKPETNLFSLIEKLHPTPAVCGFPKETSLSLINEFEDYDRGMYAGSIGWFNASGFGEFIVSIRSSLLIENKLFAFAGCGIVEESDPESEYDETGLKFNTILSLFIDAIED